MNGPFKKKENHQNKNTKPTKLQNPNIFSRAAVRSMLLSIKADELYTEWEWKPLGQEK